MYQQSFVRHLTILAFASSRFLNFTQGSDDNVVKVWCTNSGYLIHTIRAHQTITRTNSQYMIVELEIDPDNQFIVTASSDKTIRYWDLNTYMPMGYIHIGKEILNIKIAPSIIPDKKYLIVGCGDGKVRLFEWKEHYFDWNPIVLDGGTLTKDQVVSSSCHVSGLKFVTGGDDGILYLFSLHHAHPKLIRLFEKHVAPVNQVCFSEFGDVFASCCKHGTLTVYKYNESENSYKDISVSVHEFAKSELAHLDHVSQMEKHIDIPLMAWSCNDSMILTASGDNAIRGWNSNDLTHACTLLGHSDAVSLLLAHPLNPRFALSAGLDGRMFIWDLYKGKSIFEDKIPEQIVCGNITPDGNLLILTDYSGSMYFYGIGFGQTFEDVPSEQFFLLDWVRVREDAYGALIDEECQQPAHMVESGELVSFQRVPLLEIYRTRGLQIRLQGFPIENHFVRAYYQLRATAHDLITRVSTAGASDLPAVIDKKQLLKRRRQIATDSPPPSQPQNVHLISQQDALAEPIVMPASSEDEYSEGESSSTEEHDENAILEFSPNGSFMEPDSEGSHEEGPLTRRKRQRLQEESSDYENSSDNVRYPLRTKTIMNMLHLSDDELEQPITSRRTRNSARGVFH
jgi:WD40 repeat protein